MGDFSEAQPQGEVTPASERCARGSLSSFRAKALPLQTTAPPKAGTIRRKENRVKEKDKGMFQDSKNRELFSPNRSCV